MQKKKSAKKWIRTLCLALALCFVFAFSSCAEIFADIISNSTASRPSTEKDTDLRDSPSDRDSADTSKDSDTDSDEGQEEEEKPIEPIVVPQSVTEKYGYQKLREYADGEAFCDAYAQLYQLASEFALSTKNLQGTTSGSLGTRYRLGSQRLTRSR